MKIWYDLDKDNNVIGPYEHEIIHERHGDDFEWKRVAKTTVAPGTEVSTVFLGLDHSFINEGPPIVFETLVFSDDKSINQWERRYSTWEEAEKGHEEVVRKLMEGDTLD